MEFVSSPKVAAVVVTFNRLNLLKRSLTAIDAQSFPVETIIIIDNASTDGTQEYLNNIDYENFKTNMKVVFMPTNTGGAGGFEMGLRQAYDMPVDYIWLMDDDGSPSVDCLQNLIDKGDNHSIFNPLVIDEDDHSRLAFKLGKMFTVSDAKSKSVNDLIKGLANPFNGTFFSKDIVSKIGFPKKEMFIWGDEEEYMMRAKVNGVEIYTNTLALHFHPKEKGIRQPVLFNLMGTVVLKPNNMLKIYLRNQIYICRKYNLYFRMLKTIIKYGVYGVLNLKVGILNDIFFAINKSKSL